MFAELLAAAANDMRFAVKSNNFSAINFVESY